MTQNTQIETLGNFLAVVNFTHFCTFTSRRPISLNATRRIAENVAKYVDAGNTGSMFWAAEKFDVREGYHFHALLATPINAMDIFGWYFPRYGRCQIIDNTDPERQQQASYYCSKYVTKALADYDIYFSRKIAQRHHVNAQGEQLSWKDFLQYSYRRPPEKPQ